MSEGGTLQRELAADISRALEIATEHLGLPFGIVSRVQDDTYHVQHVVAPADAGLHAGQTFELGTTYCAITLASDDLVTIDEMGRSAHRGHPCYEAFGLESYIGVPVRVRGEVYGTLNFSGPERRERDYGKAERGLVRLVAALCERSLERERLLVKLGQATQGVMETASLYKAMFDHIGDGVVIHRDGVALHANERLAELVGLDDPAAVVGLSLASFVPDRSDREDVRARLEKLARGEIPEGPSQVVLGRADGERRVIETVGVPVRLRDGAAALTLVRDITERRNTEMRLMRAERLASIGALAAGVAHELNNPLAYVIANLEVVSEDLGEIMGGSPSQRFRNLLEAVDEARQGAERARRIVRDLKTFSRVDVEERAPQDLRRLIDVAVNMTANELRHRARLVREYEEIPLVVVDEARLTQVFVNLLMNAAQAITEGAADRHEIRILARATADQVCVEVLDTGSGFSDAVLPHVFDPFFTTKAPGEGTGLGLALSHNILVAHGGTIQAENRSSGGAKLTVRVPISTIAASEPDAAPEDTLAGVRGRVLVIDDDRLVGRSVERVLAREHDVTVVQAGADALELLGRDGVDFDVILCDLMMPTMPGWEVFERIEEAHPELARRVIFMSGGTLGSEGRRFLDRVDNVRLEKPFETKNLRALVAGMVRQRT